MSEFHWPTILIISLIVIGSGIAGALIQRAISAFKKRTQTIGRRVDIFPAFEDTVGALCHSTDIKFSDGTTEYRYKELHIVQIQLTNQGDYNYDEFKFGISLSEGNFAVYIEAQLPNRHHQVEQLTPVTFSEPKSQIDLLLPPLNKKGTYTLRLLILVPEGSKEPGEIQFSSPLDIEFVHLPTATEVLEEAVSSTNISFGPFSVSFPK
ncbi:hypothetical protein PN499_13520 [Kamptonema animale CS-326]|jgi:hypothetical protein|uniref:hypothetical protein n=1 Tax=Kamptonema animale TaxID=92934 RepID=UPI00232E0EAA|nr:hypothetical protein [Kamptonema animale]MDB9512207.1 hypothetical protein [Kamptonema animale CS-326]